MVCVGAEAPGAVGAGATPFRRIPCLVLSPERTLLFWLYNTVNAANLLQLSAVLSLKAAAVTDLCYSNYSVFPSCYSCLLSCPDGQQLSPASSGAFSCNFATGAFEPSVLPACKTGILIFIIYLTSSYLEKFKFYILICTKISTIFELSYVKGRSFCHQNRTNFAIISFCVYCKYCTSSFYH